MVDRWVGIYLPIGSFLGESFDVVQRGFAGVQFFARSSGPFRLQVEDVHVTDYDFHGVDLQGAGEWRRYRVLLDEGSQRGFGVPRPFTGQLSQLSWLIDPPDGSNQLFDLQVDGVVLLKKP